MIRSRNAAKITVKWSLLNQRQHSIHHSRSYRLVYSIWGTFKQTTVKLYRIFRLAWGSTTIQKLCFWLPSSHASWASCEGSFPADGRFDGFDTSQKSGPGTGLKLGGLKTGLNLSGGWFTRNPMQLYCCLFKRIQYTWSQSPIKKID